MALLASPTPAPPPAPPTHAYQYSLLVRAYNAYLIFSVDEIYVSARTLPESGLVANRSRSRFRSRSYVA